MAADHHQSGSAPTSTSWTTPDKTGPTIMRVWTLEILQPRRPGEATRPRTTMVADRLETITETLTNSLTTQFFLDPSNETTSLPVWLITSTEGGYVLGTIRCFELQTQPVPPNTSASTNLGLVIERSMIILTGVDA